MKKNTHNNDKFDNFKYSGHLEYFKYINEVNIFIKNKNIFYKIIIKK